MAKMIWIYSLTILIGASLLFLVQPIIAKLILPVFGSSAQVWTTSVMFFQCVLLFGYYIAHLLSTMKQKGLGITIFCLAILLPILVPLEYEKHGLIAASPTVSLLYILVSSIGIHFLLLSTCSPLLQHWLSLSHLKSASRPYFLYAISNFGSLAVLLAYPFVIEPFSLLSSQINAWNVLYVILAALIVTVGAYTYVGTRRPASTEKAENNQGNTKDLSIGRISKWTFWAFIPSGLMLSVSTFLSNEIAAIPLLWIIPLFLYLLTLTIVFTPQVTLPIKWFVLAAPILIITSLMIQASRAVEPLSFLIALFVVTLFVIAMVCHWKLVQDKPAARHLTVFYLALAFGGALGGVFTAIVSPLIFNDYYEFPLFLLLAAGALPSRDPAREQRSNWNKNLIWGLVPVAVMLLFVGLLQFLLKSSITTRELHGFLGKILVIPLPFLLCYLTLFHRQRFFISLFSCTIAGFLLYGASTNNILLYQERTFYGVSKVLHDKQNHRMLLWHGGTIHGIQSDLPPLRDTPAAYYHPSGPAGDIFVNFNRRPTNIALVGLGAGTLSAYGRPGDRYDYFEIDPVVVDIATNAELFTFVSTANQRNSINEFHVGDARLTLANAKNSRYDIIVLDAFSSGSIPTHLLTLESLTLYVDKLRQNGILLFHISNNFLDFEVLLCSLALEKNMACFTKSSGVDNENQQFQNKLPSRWLVMTEDPHKTSELERLGWSAYDKPPMAKVWTDNFSSILHVLR